MKSAEGNRDSATSLSTKERIQREAITIFSKKGYDATSMREIAEASTVTKPVIYYYFKSKENLCNHLISSAMEEFRQQIRGVCEGSSGDVFEQLVRMVQIHFDFCRGHMEFVRFIYALNFGPDRKKIDYDFYSYGMEIFRMITGVMCRASEAGMIREGKEETAADYLRGIINMYVMLYVDGRYDLPPELARTIVTDMVNGLKP